MLQSSKYQYRMIAIQICIDVSAKCCRHPESIGYFLRYCKICNESKSICKSIRSPFFLFSFFFSFFSALHITLFILHYILLKYQIFLIFFICLSFFTHNNHHLFSSSSLRYIKKAQITKCKMSIVNVYLHNYTWINVSYFKVKL